MHENEEIKQLKAQMRELEVRIDALIKHYEPRLSPEFLIWWKHHLATYQHKEER